MVKPLLDIVLNNEEGSYRPGDTVSGVVKLKMEPPRKIRGLELCYKGVAYTSWTKTDMKRINSGQMEMRTKNMKFRMFYYEGFENYFKEKYFLVGGKGQEIDLPSGENVYEFSFILPPVLPSSFENPRGYVRYSVKATVIRAWKSCTFIKRIITVTNQYDLNLLTNVREPVNVSMKKYACCLWCRSGPLLVTVSVPRTGYVPGQTIPVNVVIKNSTRVTVNKIIFVLKQLVCFYSTRPVRDVNYEENDIVTKVQVCRVDTKEDVQIEKSIKVPPLPASGLDNCNIIDVNYYVETIIKLAGVHLDMSAVIPITLGHVPLRDIENYKPSAPVPETIRNKPSVSRSLSTFLTWISGLTSPILPREGEEHYLQSKALYQVPSARMSYPHMSTQYITPPPYSFYPHLQLHYPQSCPSSSKECPESSQVHMPSNVEVKTDSP